ncbi:MAG: hypothetical protein V9H26_29025 [Verrucomicrobiota bacterium]
MRRALRLAFGARWLTRLRSGLRAGLLSVLKALRSALGLALLRTRRAAVLRGLRTPVVESLLRTLRRAGAGATVIVGFAFFAGEAEVHLFLEAVHLGDLHFHFVAQAEHAAIAPAGQRARALRRIRRNRP